MSQVDSVVNLTILGRAPAFCDLGGGGGGGKHFMDMHGYMLHACTPHTSYNVQRNEPKYLLHSSCKVIKSCASYLGFIYEVFVCV